MKTSMLVVTLVLATLYGSPASAEDDGTTNLACNAWCRHWLNIGSPPPSPQLDPVPREAAPAQPLDLNASGVVPAEPPLTKVIAVTAVKRVRSAKAPVAPRRLRAQHDPAVVMPRPKPQSTAANKPAAADPAETSAAAAAPAPSPAMPAPAPATPAPAALPPADAAAISQIMAMLALPALPADPILITQPQAPASQAHAQDAPAQDAPAPARTPAPKLIPMAATSLPGALPVVAQQIAVPVALPPAAPATPSPTPSPMIMPPAFDVIATLLLDGPTQP